MPTFEATDRPPLGSLLLEREMESDPYYKPATIDRLMATLKAKGYVDRTDEEKVHLCLDEGITNALRHGNRSDRTKRIRCRLFGADDRWSLIVEDEGEGMKPEKVPDPHTPEGQRRESGRGILLMESHFDEIVYLGRGNQLLMIRRRSAHDPIAIQEGRKAMPLSLDAAASTDQMPSAETDLALRVEMEDDDYLVEPTHRPIVGELVSATEVLKIHRVDGVPVLEVLPARMSDVNIAAVRDQMLEASQGQAVVVVDLRHVEYVSSVVIGALVGVANRVEEAGGVMRLAGLQQMLLELLDTTGVAELFEVYPDHRAALAGEGSA